jgi:hypothetical protein
MRNPQWLGDPFLESLRAIIMNEEWTCTQKEAKFNEALDREIVACSS